jgi:hypothetical protein
MDRYIRHEAMLGYGVTSPESHKRMVEERREKRKRNEWRERERERERLFSGEICFHRVIRPLKTDFFFLHYFFVNLVLLPNKKAE